MAGGVWPRAGQRSAAGGYRPSGAPLFSLFSMTLGCIARFRGECTANPPGSCRCGTGKRKAPARGTGSVFYAGHLVPGGEYDHGGRYARRGYGKGRRRVYDPFTFGVADGVELAVVLLLSITVLAVALTGGLTFYFDPQLEWVTLSPLGAAAAGLLCFCPTISNVGEALQWRRLKRKN